MYEFNVAILATSAAVLILGLFSRLLKRWSIPDPLLLLSLGMLLGPHGLGILDPTQWGDSHYLLEQAARLALAIGLMGVALRIPKFYTRDHWKSVLALLLVAMPTMWIISSLLMAGLLQLPLAKALLLGAIVTPTDPVVASSIVTGPIAQANLPDRLRNLLSAESGLNDGLGLAFVALPLYLLTQTTNEAVIHFGWVLIWQIGGAVLMGAVLGYIAGRLLRMAEDRRFMEEPSILAFTIALALATLSLVKLLGSDGILAVFVAGVAFDQTVEDSEQRREERVVEGVDRFFTLPIFALLGLLIPWKEWMQLGSTGLLLAAAILLLRRLPLFMIAGGKVPDLPDRRDRLFAGWFGPIGVAAMYYAALAAQRTEVEQTWPVVSLVICASIAAHGLTSAWFSYFYARHGGSE